MNMKALMILVVLLCEITCIDLYAMKEKETEEGGRGVKRKAEISLPIQTMLHNAQEALEVRNVIELGPDPNKLNDKGQTAINALISCGNFEGVNYLIKQFGENLDLVISDEFGVDPLHNAIHQKNPHLALDIIELLEKQNKVVEVLEKKDKLGNNALDLAIEKGLFQLIPDMINFAPSTFNFDEYEKNINVVMKNAQGALEMPSLQIALYYFCRYFVKGSHFQFLDLFEHLLKRGVDINALYGYSITVLMYAIGVKNRDLIELLLKYGADVNACIRNGWTSLMVAAGRFSDSIPLLLEKGAHLEDKTTDGATALIVALHYKNKEAVELLLKAGADVNAYNKPSFTPLMVAAEHSSYIIPVLLEKGARLEDKTADGVTALSVAIYNNNKEAVELLLKAGANSNARDEDGESPLMYAIRAKNKDLVELLLKAGAEVNAYNKIGWTPLMVAAERFSDSIPLLPENGAHLEDKTADGATALLVALHYKNKEAVELLLRAGADVNAYNKQSFTPLMVAAEHSFDIIPLLLEKGARLEDKDVDGATALLVAISNNNKEAVELLLKAGADANACNKNDSTPLMNAAEFFAESIPLLIAKGARLEDKTKLGSTALMYAIFNNNKEAVELLLEAGADANARNKNDSTPLIYAAERFSDSIPLLLKKGARLEDKNGYGLMALMIGIASKNKEAVKLLLEAGADVNDRNKAGKTVLEVAQLRSTPEIVALIEAKLKEEDKKLPQIHHVEELSFDNCYTRRMNNLTLQQQFTEEEEESCEPPSSEINNQQIPNSSRFTKEDLAFHKKLMEGQGNTKPSNVDSEQSSNTMIIEEPRSYELSEEMDANLELEIDALYLQLMNEIMPAEMTSRMADGLEFADSYSIFEPKDLQKFQLFSYSITKMFEMFKSMSHSKIQDEEVLDSLNSFAVQLKDNKTILIPDALTFWTYYWKKILAVRNGDLTDINQQHTPEKKIYPVSFDKLRAFQQRVSEAVQRLEKESLSDGMCKTCDLLQRIKTNTDNPIVIHEDLFDTGNFVCELYQKQLQGQSKKRFLDELHELEKEIFGKTPRTRFILPPFIDSSNYKEMGIIRK
jgi:ankyrin repeat protein